MKNKEKKVIILKNLSSPFISQAIIILKDNTPAGSNIIEEAEKLVSGYFPENQQKNPPKSNRKLIFGGISATIATFLMFLCIRFLF